jgi:hypothetical protein
MTITELIASLEAIKAKHGDILVFCWPYDGQIAPYELDMLDVDERNGDIFLTVDTSPDGRRLTDWDLKP